MSRRAGKTSTAITESKKPTKVVKIEEWILKGFPKAPEQALAYLIQSSLGVTMAQILSLMAKLLDSSNVRGILATVLASTTIRGRVNHQKLDALGLGDYPDFKIDGDRETGDDFNFRVMVYVGAALCHASDCEKGKEILDHLGDPILGVEFSDDEAGVIRMEMSKRFTTSEKEEFRSTLALPTWQVRRARAKRYVVAIPFNAEAFATNYREKPNAGSSAYLLDDPTQAKSTGASASASQEAQTTTSAAAKDTDEKKKAGGGS